MKIGIILYSQTGNTRSVALKLKEKLTGFGHKAAIEEIKASGTGHGPSAVHLTSIPDASLFDALVLAAPVQAFTLTMVMKSYCNHLPSLNGTKVAFLLTQFFPFRWMGGTRALRVLKGHAERLGAVALGGEVVNWSRKNRVEIIEAVTDRLAKLFA